MTPPLSHDMKKWIALPYDTRRDFIVSMVTEFAAFDSTFVQLQKVMQLEGNNPSEDYLNTTYFFIQNMNQLQKSFTSKKISDKMQQWQQKIHEAEEQYEAEYNNSDELINSL